MKDAGIGIVIPKYNNSIQTRYNFPVGLAYIKGALKNHGYKVYGINLNHVSEENVERRLEEFYRENNIGIVLCGGLSAHYSIIKSVFDAAKRVKREIIKIGGVAGSHRNQFCLQK